MNFINCTNHDLVLTQNGNEIIIPASTTPIKFQPDEVIETIINGVTVNIGKVKCYNIPDPQDNTIYIVDPAIFNCYSFTRPDFMLAQKLLTHISPFMYSITIDNSNL